ncbi:MAG: cytochrome P450 [Acidimicrobiales bacterium]|jgi:cytochrome P450
MRRVLPRSLGEIDLSDVAFWERPYAEREGAFELLRRDDPIRFFAEHEEPPMPLGRGYYALTRHHQVIAASRQPDVYSSGGGTNIPDLPESFREFFGSMINLDDPRHARMRRIVSRAFTPRMLDQTVDSVAAIAAAIVDDLIDMGSCDFVTEVAAALPLRVISDLMGIARSEESFIFRHSNIILGALDPEYVPDQSTDSVITAMLNSGQELANMVEQLGAERQRHPRNDLITGLVTAEVEGDHLSPQELGSFFILLVVAGNETTRNAIAHGLVALTDHPQERRRLIADLDGMMPTAVEEIVRWATPVIHFRRTVTRDGAELDGQRFAEGDKVVLWYNSANRDEAVFDDPYRFDVGRRPNDHVGFGGPGPHFCLGAHLARREISVMFSELLRRVPDIRAVGEPERLRSSFINGLKHVRAEFQAGGGGTP